MSVDNFMENHIIRFELLEQINGGHCNHFYPIKQSPLCATTLQFWKIVNALSESAIHRAERIEQLNGSEV